MSIDRNVLIRIPIEEGELYMVYKHHPSLIQQVQK